MAGDDPALALSVPGRLTLGPTQDGIYPGAFPHGGTPLGIVGEVHVERTEQMTPIFAEEFGQIVGAVRGFETWVLGFTLQQYDPDALALIYRTTTTSRNGFSGARTVRESLPGVVAPSAPVLFSPDDSANPGVLLYAPIPQVGPATQRLDLSLVKGLEIGVILLATRDPAGRVIAIDRLEHLSL